MKKEIRVLGIDDSAFDKFKDKTCLIIGTVFRGGNFIDGVMTTEVDVDGTNATENITKMINRSKFKSQLRVILLDGIFMAGFNILDIEKIHATTKIPVIAVMRKIPNIRKIESILKKIGMKDKVSLMKKAGKIEKCQNIYVQSKGLTSPQVREILKICCTHADIPEALRVSHIIAAGVVLGESHGDA